MITKKDKSLQYRLDEIKRQRKALLLAKSTLIKENHGIISEGRDMRKALRESLLKLRFKRVQTN